MEYISSDSSEYENKALSHTLILTNVIGSFLRSGVSVYLERGIQHFNKHLKGYHGINIRRMGLF